MRLALMNTVKEHRVLEVGQTYSLKENLDVGIVRQECMISLPWATDQPETLRSEKDHELKRKQREIIETEKKKAHEQKKILSQGCSGFVFTGRLREGRAEN